MGGKSIDLRANRMYKGLRDGHSWFSQENMPLSMCLKPLVPNVLGERWEKSLITTLDFLEMEKGSQKEFNEVIATWLSVMYWALFQVLFNLHFSMTETDTKANVS